MNIYRCRFYGVKFKSNIILYVMGCLEVRYTYIYNEKIYCILFMFICIEKKRKSTF